MIGRPPKPIHTFSQVKSITKHRAYAEKAILDYWHNNRRTEIFLKDIIKIECDCEEMLITIKSDRIRSFRKRASRKTTAVVSAPKSE